MNYKGVIFDLDGTLINTLDDLTTSMNFALDKVRCPRRSTKECRRMVGNGLIKFAERALPSGQTHLHGELLTLMASYYQQHCLDKTAPYEGILDVVEVLREKGIRVAVLTNKNQEPAEVVVKHFFGEGVFNPILGICEGRKVKPAPDSTLQILKQWQLTREEVLFVGDSEVDVQTALSAGVVSIGCEWGFRDKEQLLAAGAEILIQKPVQLLGYLG